MCEDLCHLMFMLLIIYMTIFSCYVNSKLNNTKFNNTIHESFSLCDNFRYDLNMTDCFVNTIDL